MSLVVHETTAGTEGRIADATKIIIGAKNAATTVDLSNLATMTAQEMVVVIGLEMVTTIETTEMVATIALNRAWSFRAKSAG